MPLECTILLPVFNEERSILSVIDGVRREMAGFTGDFEILAINDGSTDSTGELLRNCEGVRVISHQSNMGYGASVKTGVKAAQGRRVLLMDADASYPAELIQSMIEAAGRFDMVVGARRSPFIPNFFFRGLARWLFKALVSLLVWKWIPDLNSGMRVFDAALCGKYLHLLPDGFSASSTITVTFMRNNHSILYMDIPYRTRVGLSKLNVIIDGARFLRFLLRGGKGA